METITLHEKILELEKLALLTKQYKVLSNLTDNPNLADYYELKEKETKQVHDELLKEILKEC